jgi:hypothetical protein
VQFGDLLVGQLAILAKQKDFFFLRTQTQQRPAQLFHGLLLFEGMTRWGFGLGYWHRFGSEQRFHPASPCRALQVLGGVEANAEDPGPQVVDLRYLLLSAPAAQEGFLGDVLCVLPTAQHKPEGAYEFITQVIESAQEDIPGRSFRRGFHRQFGQHTRSWSAHAVTLPDE